MLEKEIENYLAKEIKKVGGLCYKFVSPGNAGVPDRLCILNNGRVFFAELKAPGKKPRPSQSKQILRMRQCGQTVYVIDSKTQIDFIIKQELQN